MIKKVLPLAVLAILLTGCTEAPEETTPVETDPAETVEVQTDPFTALQENHDFNFNQVQSTQITITSDNLTQLTVEVKEDGYIDDSIKGATYTLNLKRQEDNSWEVLNKEQTDLECYRDKTEEGLCL